MCVCVSVYSTVRCLFISLRSSSTASRSGLTTASAGTSTRALLAAGGPAGCTTWVTRRSGSSACTIAERGGGAARPEADLTRATRTPCCHASRGPSSARVRPFTPLGAIWFNFGKVSHLFCDECGALEPMYSLKIQINVIDALHARGAGGGPERVSSLTRARGAADFTASLAPKKTFQG